MQQLPLDVHLADFALFESFFAGKNAAAVHSLQSAARQSQRKVICVWGATHSGKSHLLQATVAEASAQGAVAAYLPLGSDECTHPELLEGMGSMDLLCLDEVQKIAGQSEWERRLFGVFEEMAQHDGRFVVAGDAPISSLPFSLPDLSSRLASGETYRLHDLDDDDRASALRLRARWRGLELPEETARYLLSRVDRNTGGLFKLLDRLDAAAMTAQRRLTVPFVRSVIEG